MLRADARRLAALVLRPTAAFWVGVCLPAALLVAGVVAVGSVSSLELSSIEGGVTFGVLISGAVAFLAYPVLFRGSDDAFVRRLGVAPGALFRERALRLLGWVLAIGFLAGCAHAAGGVEYRKLLRLGIPVVLTSWGAALLATSAAAHSMAGRPPGSTGTGRGCLTIGMWDREVAGAAPLVYAPVPALAAGALVGGVVAGVDAGAAWVISAIGAVAVSAAVLARRLYERALPRFAPQALEMSFAPPPVGEGNELRRRRGLARVLPRRAAAVWARDGVVASRRYAWATRVVWPVVAFSLVALARWGESPGPRGWVVSAAVAVLVLQGAAAIGLGRLERRGPRWIDRMVGFSIAARFVGRWAWGWGISLWMTIPLALAWTWWSGMGRGWIWVVAAGGTSALAAAASVGAAGRR